MLCFQLVTDRCGPYQLGVRISPFNAIPFASLPYRFDNAAGRGVPDFLVSGSRESEASNTSLHFCL